MRPEDLTPEQREKALACTSLEELMDLAKEEGLDLSDDEIEGITGGGWLCPEYQHCDERGYIRKHKRH